MLPMLLGATLLPVADVFSSKDVVMSTAISEGRKVTCPPGVFSDHSNVTRVVVGYFQKLI